MTDGYEYWIYVFIRMRFITTTITNIIKNCYNKASGETIEIYYGWREKRGEKEWEKDWEKRGDKEWEKRCDEIIIKDESLYPYI